MCIEGHCDDLLARVVLSCSDCTTPHHTLDKTIERGGVAALTRSRRGNPCYLGFGHIVIRPWHLSPPPHHIILIRDRKASLIFIIYQRRGVLSTTIQQGCPHVRHSLAECNYRHRRRGRSEGDHGCNTDKCNTILAMCNSCLWLFHLLFGMTGELIIGCLSTGRSDCP